MALSSPIPKIATLPVSELELPREFEKLYDIAYNLWWTWTPEARELFASIDTAKWGLYRNPVQLLINVDPRHWYPLLEDDAFQTRYHALVERYETYLHGFEESWFHRSHPGTLDKPIAYFSMEYGLHQSLAIYSGGLGILSGDHCKSASDLGLPFVAVGLLYRRGYFMQSIDADGLQQHIYPEYDFTRLPVRPVATAAGREVFVEVPLPGRTLRVKLWLAQVGRVPLILLDTDLPDNDPADRPITNLLYVRGREMRLVQEVVLGVGGAKALETLGIEPAAWHLNEGHSVFLNLERLRRRVRDRGMDPTDALADLKRNAVFTTHTPVPAGNEQFDPNLVDKYFAAWCGESGVSQQELRELGKAHDHDDQFNLTALAVRTSSWVNGVSKLNGEIAGRMWKHLFPADVEEPIYGLTNGVHARTWLGPETQSLLRRRFDEDWESRLLSPEGWDKVEAIDDKAIWKCHGAQKKRLGRFVRSRLREQYARHGASPDELRAVDAIFNDHALTIGFARRFATYKRANLIFSNIDRLKSLLCNPDRPVQMIFAGKAHPADRPGQELLKRIFEMSTSDAFRGRVILLENYDMRMGGMLVQGCDVWLNTPRRPMEASGTSGQKVAMNGALNFSISDGWWPEGFDGRNGWVIGSDKHYEDEGIQDAEDVESLYDVLEHQIIPLYYERNESGLPSEWIGRMKHAMATLTPQFSASRMVRDYIEIAYLPAAARGRA